MCARFVSALPITGAAVSVFGGMVPETSICASDVMAARLDEMQFDLGEGPRWDSASSRLPVHETHVQHSTHQNWPMFGAALKQTEVAALFVYPLSVAALDVGVVELYSLRPGPLSARDNAIAQALASETAWTLLDHLLSMQEAARTTEPRDNAPLSRREIHQATGMVLVQLGSNATEALLVMRAHAFSHDKSLRDVAGDVVERRLVFAA
ncbi:GAF and ANTAR domain-containing protein [Cryobacterium frigoriphilum]|uniref:GAF and ANTAR domain-containing protein n=1 Tax=Cryobacterium frigoriphilum TaxID=1259150 RepID=UPI001F53EE75|nr:GAF and ANTAR domain-containing protein [Cryobacterium frigoriphilum]